MPADPDPPVPFRWDLARREQLGALADPGARLDPDHLAELRRVCARVLALADGADLAFVGRSPENLFDYLSGAFGGLDGAPRVHLVQFSMRHPPGGDVANVEPARRDALAAYFAAQGIGPEAIATGPRLAFVDYVARGGTFESLVKLLHDQARRAGGDWTAVQRRLILIGLRTRTKNSPATWRWQQHQDWLDLIPDAAVKNVSAPAGFLSTLAGFQPKTTPSHHAGRWAEPAARRAPNPAQREALGLAVKLYDAGRSKAERAALAGLLARSREMRSPAVRGLVGTLRRG